VDLTEWIFLVCFYPSKFAMPPQELIVFSGDNHWVHDVEVTNRDECVTVKNPASNFLIERIWCNQSGGSAIGSLGSNTTIENIIYRNVYTNGGNQIFMVKSNLGSGYVKNVQFEDFIANGTAYGLYLDQYWESSPGEGDGVELSNLLFKVLYITPSSTPTLTQGFRIGTESSRMAFVALRITSYAPMVRRAPTSHSKT
jgi:hypothetical protein